MINYIVLIILKQLLRSKMQNTRAKIVLNLDNDADWLLAHYGNANSNLDTTNRTCYRQSKRLISKLFSSFLLSTPPLTA